MSFQDVQFFSPIKVILISLPSSTSLSRLEDTMNKRTWKWSNLTLNQTVDVIVCTVYSPGEFYCQISNNSGKFIEHFSFC